MDPLKFLSTLLIAVAMAVVVTAFYDISSLKVLCKGQEIKNSQKMHTHMMECCKEFTMLHQNKMAGEKKRGPYCIQLCALKKDGFFDARGVYQEKMLNDTITKMLPMNHTKEFTEGVAYCAHAYNITSVMENPGDYTCKGYKEFFRCFSSVYFKTCTTIDPKIFMEE